MRRVPAMTKAAQRSFQKALATLVACAFSLAVTTTPATAGLRQWTSGEITDVKNDVKDAVENTKDVLDETNGIEDLIEIVKDKAQLIDDDLRDRIAERRAEAQAAIQSELSQVKDFVGSADCASGSPCGEFRSDLIQFLRDLGAIVNLAIELSNATALGLEVDYSREVDLLEKIPGAAIFPLYVAMNANGPIFGSGLQDFTSGLAADLGIARELLVPGSLVRGADVSVADFELAGDLPASCQAVIDAPGVARATSFSLIAGAMTLKVIGKVLLSRGEQQFFGGPKGVGIQGFPYVFLTQNKAKAWGAKLNNISGLVATVSASISDSLIFCAALEQRERLIAAAGDNGPPGNAPDQ